MTKLKKTAIVLVTVGIWAVVFTVHGFLHVKRLSGQCCGYEGDPGFIAVFFLIKVGVFYLIGLVAIILCEIVVFRRLSRNP